MLIALFVPFLLLHVAHTCSPSAPPEAPKEVKYAAYQIDLHIIASLSSPADNIKIDGNIVYESGATMDMHQIAMNTSGFTIRYGTVTCSNGKPLRLIIGSHTSEQVNLTLPDEGWIPKGQKYALTVYYEGALRDDENGFHKVDSLNDDDNGALHYGVTGSRMGLLAFPFVLNDTRLATINLTVRHDLEDKVVSSGEDYGLVPPVNLEFGMITKFYATSPIPPYRFGILIGKLNHVRNYMRYRRGKFYITSEARRVAEEAEKMMKELETYLKIDIPIDKLDIIVLHDLAPSVMDTWSLLLIPKEIDTQHERFLIVAEKMSRQFFTNMREPFEVDVGFFEGLGNFFKYKLLAKLFTAYKINVDCLVVESLQHSLRSDASELDYLSHRVGSIFRMFEEFLSEPVMRYALKTYTTTKDFRKSLLDAFVHVRVHAEPLTYFEELVDQLQKWFTLDEYPLLTVSISLHENEIELAQSKFTYTKTFHSVWLIPFWIGDSVFMLHDILGTFAKPAELWTLANIAKHGYYRVNYDSNIWNAIIDMLSTNHTAIPPLSRARLIDDSMTLARYGHISYNLAFNVSKYLNEETELLPWISARKHFKFLYAMTETSEAQDNVRALIANAVTPLIDRLGVNAPGNETYDSFKLRQIAIELVCLSDVKSLTSEIKDLSISDIIDNTPLCCAAVQINDTLPLQILRRFAHEANYSALECLTCTKNQLHYALLFSTSFDESLTRQTKLQIRKLIIQNGGYEGVSATINYLKQRFATAKQNRREDVENEKLTKFLARWIMHPKLRRTYFELLKIVSGIPKEEKLKIAKIVNQNMKWRDTNLQKIHEYSL